MPRIVIAKTALDGHWRGVQVVSRAFRDAGFEVVLAGMVTPEQLSAIVVQEDADAVGLNVGGHVDIVKRYVETVRATAEDVPIVAGGTIDPTAVGALEAMDVRCFPPGSALDEIVNTVSRAIASNSEVGSR